MSEEKQDWKEERIRLYAKYAKEEARIVQDMETNPKLKEIREAIAAWNKTLNASEEGYKEKITWLQNEQARIKEEFIEKWDITDKTVTCDAGSATLRTTKSLHVRSKEKLVKFLISIEKLPDFIKSFETAKLRKIKEAGLLDNEIATWDEKQSISIKLTEEE